MSIPPTISSTVTQPPTLAGLTSESVLLAAQAMTSSPVASTSTSQYSAETPLAIVEKPSTSLSQSVVMETPDPEVVLPSKDQTVTNRPFVHLCDPNAVTLPLHSTPMEPAIPVHSGTQYISPVFPGPPVLSPQLPYIQVDRPNFYT